MITIAVHRAEDSARRGHGGERVIRNIEIYVNGKLWETFSEDTQKVNWYTGAHFDAIVQKEVDRLIEFFGGTVVHSKVKQPV